MTGVKPLDTCAKVFDELKSKKTHRFILFEITADGKNIGPVHQEAPAGTCEEDWAKFSAKLTGDYATKCCYAVFDFDWAAADGHDCQKIMFVLW
jgi:cofilin